MTVYKINLSHVTPLVCHSNRCVNPLDPLKKQIASITKKRAKTDADFEKLYRLEFQGGLYWNEKCGPYVPSMNIRAMMVAGARKDKNGKQFESGLFVLGDAPIQYDGPKGIEDMFAAGFAWTTVCGNQRASIMRTRPRFEEWSLEFKIETDEDLIDVEMLKNALRHCEKIGLCDARAIGYGRFETTAIEEV